MPWYNLNGGVETGFVYVDNLDLSATLQFGDMNDWEDNLIFYVYGIGNHGGLVTDLTGDFQAASNIEAPSSYKLFELWGQKNFFEGRYSVLFGLYDLNSEFDILNSATYFINSSFGIGAEFAQSGLNGPSIFPYSSLSLRTSVELTERVLLKFLISDGVSGDPQRPRRNPVVLNRKDGLLTVAEVSLFTAKSDQSFQIEREDVSRRIKTGRIKTENNLDKLNIGTWYYTREFEELLDSSEFSRTNAGLYLGYQRSFYIESTSDRSLSVFARIGVTDSRHNRIASAVSGGLVFEEVFGSDLLGLSFSSAINSQSYLELFPEREKTETAIELMYVNALTNFLAIQPDIQYIINPDMRKELSNSFSFSVLIQASFGL